MYGSTDARNTEKDIPKINNIETVFLETNHRDILPSQLQTYFTLPVR